MKRPVIFTVHADTAKSNDADPASTVSGPPARSSMHNQINDVVEAIEAELAGAWRWVATRNGRVVAYADGYSNRANAKRAWQHFAAAISDGEWIDGDA